MEAIIIYSNDYKQIRNGLVNYVGSLLKACPFEGEKASRQYVAATLIEEAINLMKEEDTFDMYISKPLVRGNIVFLKNRKNALEQLPKTTNVKETIKKYEDTIEFLDSLIKNIN